MRRVYVRSGDAGSVLEQVLTRDGQGVNLAGASVRFLMASTPGSPPKVDQPATIVDAATGRVRYTWQTADLDTPGRYVAEWEVTYAGGAVETYPLGAYVRIQVDADLA